MKKIQLIRPPFDEWYNIKKLPEYTSFPSNLLLLEKTARNHAEMEVLDAMDESLERTLEKVDKDADIVGVTFTHGTQRSGYYILEKAKRNGSKTIAGGPAVKHLAKRIINNRDFIDFVVDYDGQFVLEEIINGKEPEFIPNIVFRDSYEAKDSLIKRKNDPMNIIYDLDAIDKSKIDFTKPATISMIRGCIKVPDMGRCDFCSIDHDLKVMSAKRAWEQIELLYDRYGITNFIESGDSFMAGSFPEKFLNARPERLKNTTFEFVFTSPDQLNDYNVKILQNLNIKRVFIGLETLSDEILRNNHKSYDVEQIKYSIDLATSHGMKLHVPFLYGLEGESTETIKQTYAFAKKLAKDNPSIVILSGIAVPFPGTNMFKQLQENPKTKNQYSGNLDTDDIMKFNELVRLYADNFTSAGYAACYEVWEKTRMLQPNKNKVATMYFKDNT